MPSSPGFVSAASATNATMPSRKKFRDIKASYQTSVVATHCRSRYLNPSVGRRPADARFAEPPCVSMRLLHGRENRMLTHGGSEACPDCGQALNDVLDSTSSASFNLNWSQKFPKKTKDKSTSVDSRDSEESR